MKLPSLAAALVFSTLVPAFAITEAEITPAALVGKTLTFTVNTAGGAFANTGSWTGTFGNPAFTVTRVTGNTVNITTTHSTVANGFTTVTLPKYIEGSGTTTIVLYTANGIGKYEMNFNPVDSAYQIGTFTIGSSVPKEPEMGVQDPKGKPVTDNKSKQNFGSVQTGKTGATRKYTLKNTGTAKLTGLAITKSGANKGDFIFTGLGATSLAPGKSTTFKLSFKPASTGTRNAVIKIASNDADESTFDLKVTGTGAAK